MDHKLKEAGELLSHMGSEDMAFNFNKSHNEGWRIGIQLTSQAILNGLDEAYFQAEKAFRKVHSGYDHGKALEGFIDALDRCKKVTLDSLNPDEYEAEEIAEFMEMDLDCIETLVHARLIDFSRLAGDSDFQAFLKERRGK